MKKILIAAFLISNIFALSAFASMFMEKKKCLEDMHEDLQNITQVLNLSYCGLDDSDLVKVVAYVNRHSIHKLNLAGNNISAEGAKLISEVKTIDALDLSYNHIGTSGAKVLAKSSYQFLGVNANGIGKTGVTALADSKNLNVDLGNNHLDGDDILYLLKNKNHTLLNLEKATFTPQAIKALARDSKITGLDLSYTNLSAEDVEQIIANKRLIILSLRGMNLFYVKGLENQTTLQMLTLAENNFGSVYTNEFANVINLPRLLFLDLSENKLTSYAIIDSLNKLTHLFIQLQLNRNLIDDSAIDTIISKHPLIESLSITRNHFSGEGLSKLVSEYPLNSVLKFDGLKASVVGISSNNATIK